ncbi:MAG: AraC family transcriptional regulator [Pseudomonadota bacterium]
MNLTQLNDAVGEFLEARPAVEQGIETGVRDLWVHTYAECATIDAAIYTPIISLTLQGQKEVRWGAHSEVFCPGDSFVVSHDLPVQSRVVRASQQEPFRALALNLDVPLLRDLHHELDRPLPIDDDANVIESSVADDELVAAFGRYFMLNSDESAMRLMGPIIRREIHARLLLAPNARMLRRLLDQESQAAQIAKAIVHIRQNLSTKLSVDRLSRLSGMSLRSFHAHFKSITDTTPLQYQKELRLIEARRLMQAEGKAVGTAAFEVGYESPTQFSREFARRFGQPPSRDTAQSASL